MVPVILAMLAGPRASENSTGSSWGGGVDNSSLLAAVAPMATGNEGAAEPATPSLQPQRCL